MQISCKPRAHKITVMRRERPLNYVFPIAFMDCPYRWSTRESNLRALLAAMSAIGSSLETPHKFLVQNGIVNNPTRPK